jgi:SAM-dependent methyltransferase
MSYTGTVIVIPTRNRADLVRNAISSVLNQSDCEPYLLVSDNSTLAAQRTELSDYCRQAANGRLRYIVPPEPLPMSEHWDWAMRQALSLYDASHIGFLTDRMMFKPDALKSLVEIISSYPDKILTYMHDMVDDFTEPVVLRQYTWTGNLYEVFATRLLEMIAQSIMYDSSIPRMLNCLVPRTLLQTISRRFGTIFDSISPDWNFACRALALENSILFHDKAALVHYAQSRSTGQSTHRGMVNEAQAQFMGDLKGARLNESAPFPEILTVWNGIISEYCRIKEITQDPKFPEVNLDNYRQALAVGVAAIQEPRRQDQMQNHLLARGWEPQNDVLPSAISSVPASEEAPTIDQFSTNSLEFQDLAEALDSALKHPRARTSRSDHETLIEGVKRALPQELFGKYAPLVPPLELMHDGPVGYQEFKDNGEEFFRYYTTLCSLKPDEKMLDVGCGVGRKTFPLTDYLRAPGGYEGLDIVKTGIDWCRERITRRNACFRFQWIDVFNQHYNPTGRQKARDYKFPFPDESFDFVVLASVFTHMLPEDAANYLSETARVLRRGGRCLISFFLLNELSRRLLVSGKSSAQFTAGFVPCWTVRGSAPESVVGFDEDFVLSLYERYHLEIKPPILYGSWCGRDDFLSYQDLIIAFKPASRAREAI